MVNEYLGADIAFDQDGDLMVGQTGDMVLATGKDCLVQDVLDRLRIIPGDLWNHTEWGCEAGKMLGAKDTPLNRALIARHIRMALEAEPRIDSETIRISVRSFTQEQKTFLIEFSPAGSASSESFIWGFGLEDIAELNQ